MFLPAFPCVWGSTPSWARIWWACRSAGRRRTPKWVRWRPTNPSGGRGCWGCARTRHCNLINGFYKILRHWRIKTILAQIISNYEYNVWLCICSTECSQNNKNSQSLWLHDFPLLKSAEEEENALWLTGNYVLRQTMQQKYIWEGKSSFCTVLSCQTGFGST